MNKYIDAEKLKVHIEAKMETLWDKLPDADKEHPTDIELRDLGMYMALEGLTEDLDSLQQELDSHSIPVLRADTTEKQDRILEIIGQDKIYCHFPLDFGKETDCGYEDYNDRIYIDGDLTFNKMAEIVDFLSKNSK